MPSGKNPKHAKDQCPLFGDSESRRINNSIKKGRSSHQPAPDSAVMYCDGASSGNPGNAGIGVVIYLPGEEGPEGKNVKIKISRYIGIATNNVSEYSALIAGLEKAVSLGTKKIKIYLDSELLVRQINGIYKVKNKNLQMLWMKVKNILKEFDTYNVSHVRRELNKEADALAREGVKKGLRR
jgi:ribonuclease HI